MFAPIQAASSQLHGLLRECQQSHTLMYRKLRWCQDAVLLQVTASYVREVRKGDIAGDTKPVFVMRSSPVANPDG